MKLLSTFASILFMANLASAADFVIQVQASSKNWKVKNGSTVVAVLDRDQNGSTVSTIFGGSPYVSTIQSSQKLNGSIVNGPKKFFSVKALDVGMNPQLTTVLYFASPGCTGTVYSGAFSKYLDGIYKFANKVIYVSSQATEVTSFAYQSQFTMDIGVCTDGAGTESQVYPTQNCTVATCGFDENSVLEVVHE